MMNKINIKQNNLGFALYCVFALCYSCSSCYAQNYKIDLEKASEIYKKNAFEVEMEHLLYPSLTSSIPIERAIVWMCKSGDNYHLKQYGIELICNAKYVLMINESAKVVAIDYRKQPQKDKREKKEEKESHMLLLKAMKDLLVSLGVDTLLNAEEEYNCKYLGEINGSKTYLFNYKYGEYTQVTVSVSSHTGLLEKISCIYRRPMEVEKGVFNQIKVDIIFRKQISVENFSDSIFSINKFLSITDKGEINLNNQYKQYSLIDNINGSIEK